MVLLDVEGLTTALGGVSGVVRPVDDVSFSIDAGETLCLVGESGSGKSMTALTIMGLIGLETPATTTGRILYNGRDLLALSDAEMRLLRGQSLGMVFQEPMTALNPVLKIGRQLLQVGQYHLTSRRAKRRWTREGRERVTSTLADVGVPDPQAMLGRFPHELSGGLRQRVVIAMALLGEPDLLIADEPTTALDVTTQAQILELLEAQQRRTGMAMLLITHDMGVAAEVADRVAVMYAGRLVEDAAAGALFAGPAHPYTMGLLASVPALDGERQRRLSAIPGAVPRLDDLPGGCRFAPRCSYATEKCQHDDPPLDTVESGHGHAPAGKAACWYAGALGART